MMHIFQAHRPYCDICTAMAEKVDGYKMSQGSTEIRISPLLGKAFLGKFDKRMILCSKHHRLFLKTLDNAIDSLTKGQA